MQTDDVENEVPIEEVIVPSDSETENSESDIIGEVDDEWEEVDTGENVVTPAEEVEKWKDIATRSQADLENYRKRMTREKSEAIQFANRALLETLLPIIDNFDMGLQAAKNSDGEESVIYQGMAMVFKQIEDFLSDQGVEVILPDGQTFDPNQHEALKQEASGTVPEGSVIFTMRRGYRLKDRLLRAANVVVSAGPDSE